MTCWHQLQGIAHQGQKYILHGKQICNQEDVLVSLVLFVQEFWDVMNRNLTLNIEGHNAGYCFFSANSRPWSTALVLWYYAEEKWQKVGGLRHTHGGIQLLQAVLRVLISMQIELERGHSFWQQKQVLKVWAVISLTRETGASGFTIHLRTTI